MTRTIQTPIALTQPIQIPTHAHRKEKTGIEVRIRPSLRETHDYEPCCIRVGKKTLLEKFRRETEGWDWSLVREEWDYEGYTFERGGEGGECEDGDEGACGGRAV
jgi:hypothetical protein